MNNKRSKEIWKLKEGEEKHQFYNLIWDFGLFLCEYQGDKKITFTVLEIADLYRKKYKELPAQVDKFIGDIAELFLQIGVFAQATRRNKTNFRLNHFWKPIFESRKRLDRVNLEKGIPPDSKRTRSDRTIAMLSFLIADQLKYEPKTRDDLADNTGFSRQRICTVLSVYKSVGLIHESTEQKGNIYWNHDQSLVLPKIDKYTSYLLDLRKTRRDLCLNSLQLLQKIKLKNKSKEKKDLSFENPENYQKSIELFIRNLSHKIFQNYNTSFPSSQPIIFRDSFNTQIITYKSISEKDVSIIRIFQFFGFNTSFILNEGETPIKPSYRTQSKRSAKSKNKSKETKTKAKNKNKTKTKSNSKPKKKAKSNKKNSTNKKMQKNGSKKRKKNNKSDLSSFSQETQTHKNEGKAKGKEKEKEAIKKAKNGNSKKMILRSQKTGDTIGEKERNGYGNMNYMNDMNDMNELTYLGDINQIHYMHNVNNNNNVNNNVNNNNNTVRDSNYSNQNNQNTRSFEQQKQNFTQYQNQNSNNQVAIKMPSFSSRVSDPSQINREILGLSDEPLEGEMNKFFPSIRTQNDSQIGYTPSPNIEKILPFDLNSPETTINHHSSHNPSTNHTNSFPSHDLGFSGDHPRNMFDSSKPKNYFSMMGTTPPPHFQMNSNPDSPFSPSPLSFHHRQDPQYSFMTSSISPNFLLSTSRVSPQFFFSIYDPIPSPFQLQFPPTNSSENSNISSGNENSRKKAEKN